MFEPTAALIASRRSAAVVKLPVMLTAPPGPAPSRSIDNAPGASVRPAPTVWAAGVVTRPSVAAAAPPKLMAAFVVFVIVISLPAAVAIAPVPPEAVHAALIALITPAA